MILALTVSVFGFSHRLRSPRARLGWWGASLAGAYLLTIAVNTLRIVAAVALYRLGPVAGLSSGQAHRLLGTVLYLGALGGLAIALDRLTARREGHASGASGAAGVVGSLMVVGAYLGMTVVVPLLTGHPGGRYAEHAVTVALSALLFLAVYFVLRNGRNLMDKPTILVVEDEPAIADTIQYALESEGFRCQRLETGAGVVELLDRQPVALVVLDIGLPDLSGIEVCRRIRQRHDVPIIFLTARSGEVDRVVGLELGADDYVSKPFSPRELAARAKAVLRRARPGSGLASAGASTAFTLDEERRHITYCGRLLELSRYEYRLLAVLLKRPGRVYSRDELLELVWDAPEASLDRTVDAHVKNLRAKLRDIRPELDPIATHRGTGYALKEGL
jgi:two-component system catabolic regulation response regulator CreB